MQDLLADFFMNNPCLDARVEELMEASPAFRLMRRRKRELDDALALRLEGETRMLFLEYEAAAGEMQNLYHTGYYLMGLKLRQELRRALLGERG